MNMTRYYVGTAEQPRARRAADAIAIVFGLILLLVTAATYGSASATDQWLLDLVEPLPDWFQDVWRIGYFLGLILMVAVFAGAIAGRRRSLLRDMTIAALATIALGFLIAWLISDAVPTALPELSRPRNPDGAFPIIRVAVVTGVIMVSAPHLTRPVRWFGWSTVLLVAVSGFGLGYGLPTDALGAAGLGLMVGGTILLAYGSPRGFPDIEAVAAALVELGVPVNGLRLVPEQSWGVRTLQGTLDDGAAVEVLAYGRDAADTRLAAKTWHTLWYRDSDGTVSFSRIQAVEHEALAMLVAERGGVNVQVPLATGVAGDDTAILVRTAYGTALSEPTREQLEAVWQELMKLHKAGLAHGALTVDAISIDDGHPILGNFGKAPFNATNAHKSKDIVSLLYETATVVDTDASVAAAARVVPRDRLIDALAYLQLPALTPDQRNLVDRPKDIIGALRDAIAEATDAEPPEPAKLRRVRPKDLIMPALSLIAISALLGMLADIDFAAVWNIVRDATWILIIAGFFIGQITFLFEAFGTLFATGHPLPMRPLVVLQLAVKWIGLAIPSAAGRVTMTTLFLRKYGVPPTVAVTQGAIDGLSGFVVEAFILVVAFIAADISLDIDASDVEWGLILGIILLAAAATVVSVLRSQRLHDAVVPKIRDAWGSLAGVLATPKRLFGMLGANLASRVILGTVLWFILQSIDAPLPLVTCLVVTVATNLLSGLVPVPGGIGVAEAAMTTFLGLAGLDSDTAFAAAVVFRIATFYIPAAQGYFATNWLKEGDYI
jgi:uncharacterized membrane protein YbhN (UPF0104 family)/tRNA A-37 threonylcarbamoyl transferase component Bud32